MCKLPSSWPPAWGTQGRFWTGCCVSGGSGGSAAEFREAHFHCEKQCFFTILREMSAYFWGVELLGALLAPRWAQMRSRPPVELHLEASWSLCWRQDGPSGAKMGQVGTKLAVKFGKLRTKRRILYIHKLPIHRKAATMLNQLYE